MKKLRVSFLDKICITYILIALLGMVHLNTANIYFKDVFLSYAERQSSKLSSLIISKTIAYELENISSEVSLITYDEENDKIQGINFDTLNISKIVSDTTNRIYKYLIAIENGNLEIINHLNLDDYHELKENLEGIIYEIPFGIINNNPMLSSLGPNIPVSFHLLGDVMSNVNCEITSHGINSVMIKILLEVKVNLQVIIPLVSKNCVVNNSFPIAMKLIQGEVPSNYIGTFPIE